MSKRLAALAATVLLSRAALLHHDEPVAADNVVALR